MAFSLYFLFNIHKSRHNNLHHPARALCGDQPCQAILLTRTYMEVIETLALWNSLIHSVDDCSRASE